MQFGLGHNALFEQPAGRGESMKKNCFAEAFPGYLIEPRTEKPTAFWEGHHATNPSSIRLSCDPRVFLGYRAGGWDDSHHQGAVQIWGSHLGLAVLSPDGCRLDRKSVV